MGRKKKKEKGSGLRAFFDVKEETRHWVFSILAFTSALFFMLAAFGQAGMVGEKTFSFFTRLFGTGYYLIPLVLVLLGIAFVRTAKPNVVWTALAGSALLFVSGLGILSTTNAYGGAAGALIAAPLLSFFDFYATLIILGALFLIALLVTFDAAPSFAWLGAAARLFGKRDEDIAEIDKIDSFDDGGSDTEDEEYEEGAQEEKEARGGIAPRKRPADDLLAPLARAKTHPPRHVLDESSYSPPPLSLYERDKGKPGVGDLKANATTIKRTLQNFGINVEMDEISVGPSVTRYALKPAQGIKLSRIVGLQNDLSLALAAHPIRIEAPIPGRSLVGIEIPNTAKTTVGLSALFSDSVYKESARPLLLALGKSVTGKPMFSDLDRMPHLLIAGATGSGKTCSKDTYIFSEKGMLTFEELCPLPLNSEVDYALRVATRDGIETTSKNYNNGICDFYKITTEEGFSVEVTHEHPLWTIQNGQCGWQNGGSIKAGEYVAISRGAKLFGENKKINFSPSPNKTNKPRNIKIPEKMTEELGLFMGLLAADGGLTIKGRIVYTQADKNVLNIYTSLLKELFGITAPTVEKSGGSNKAKDVIVFSRRLKDLLAHLGMKPVGAQKKEIPKSIRQSSPEVIKSFIKGFIRNDGHISSLKGLEVLLANKNLLQQLQLLLLNFGIVSSIHEKKVKKYAENKYWRLTVYGAEFVRYSQEIGFLTKEEERKAAPLLMFSRNANKDVIPALAPILQKLRSAYRNMFAKLTNEGWIYQDGALIPKYAFGHLTSYNNGNRKPSYNTLEKILDFYEPIDSYAEYKCLADIYKSNFYWAKVKTIEKTTGAGYDFEVPGSNSFVGNGFVNHNSVAIHTIIASLIQRNAPSALRFIFIDPKRVELTLYKNIPHLLTPVITDAKKAILSLKWAAKEMERRYDILEAESVRDVASYHATIAAPAYAKAHENAKKKKSGEDAPELPERMPYIVIIIDELADIMSAYPRELEAAIVRLAQMSRAVGIHLIFSTQRPSVNVITGLIKANIPARMAFQVSSQTDSRTILDMGGAEKLLGAGDMLYVSGDMAKPIRLQSAFIGEPEIKRTSKYLTKESAQAPEDDLGFTGGTDDETALTDALTEGADDEEEDELYEDARNTVVTTGKASTTFIQRKLRVGYARAARLMDMLEERGVVGPAQGAKPREVFVGKEEGYGEVDDGYGGNSDYGEEYRENGGKQM